MTTRSAVDIVATACVACVGAAVQAQTASGPVHMPVIQVPGSATPSGKPGPVRTSLSIRCTMMRRNGSQFATTMRVSYDGGATKSKDGVSIELDGSVPELPRGRYTGVIAGIPLMETEIFELGRVGGSPVQSREFVLNTDMSFADDGRPTGLGYRATIFRLIEDFRASAAVGYCRSA